MRQDMLTYRSSWGKATWIITSLVLLLLIALAIFFITMGIKQYANDPSSSVAMAMGIALFVGIPLFTYALAPKAYSIGREGITVHRNCGLKIVIPWSSIKSVERIEKKKLRYSYRLMACGGLFGFYGLFRNSQIGTYRLYANNSDHPIYITTTKRPIVLSPDDEDEFLACVMHENPSKQS